MTRAVDDKEWGIYCIKCKITELYTPVNLKRVNGLYLFSELVQRARTLVSRKEPITLSTKAEKKYLSVDR